MVKQLREDFGQCNEHTQLKELERLGEEIRRLGEGSGRTDYNVVTYMRNEHESDRVSNRLLMSVPEMRKQPNLTTGALVVESSFL